MSCINIQSYDQSIIDVDVLFFLMPFFNLDYREFGNLVVTSIVSYVM